MNKNGHKDTTKQEGMLNVGSPPWNGHWTHSSVKYSYVIQWGA